MTYSVVIYIYILKLQFSGEEGLKKTKMLTVVDGSEVGWVRNLKNVDGC